MAFKRKALFAALSLVLLLCSRGGSQTRGEQFREGCCVGELPKRPRTPTATAPRKTLLEALYCATNNGTKNRPKSKLVFAYVYGPYAREEATLGIAVYQPDGRSGLLYDVYLPMKTRPGYSVGNMTDIQRNGKTWRVGEIWGGLWSYTRLFHMAQALATRPRVSVSEAEVAGHDSGNCQNEWLRK